MAAQRTQVAAVRAATVELPEEQRLLARVRPLRDLVAGGEQGQQRLREAAAGTPPLGREEQAAAFGAALDRAHEVLNDREPQATDKLLALVAPEARTGQHGDYYEGYLLEVSLEADSELLGAVEVLPANGDEAATATQLLAGEEHVHGNAIVSLSIDRLG